MVEEIIRLKKEELTQIDADAMIRAREVKS